MSYDQFLRFIFPEGMFDYFELSDFKEKSDRVEIYFEEKNIHPQEYATDNLESKGFYEQVRMQDYPMRGRSCLLFIKKRRWFNHSTGKYVSRNWKLVAEGTQITTEFASFFKSIGSTLALLALVFWRIITEWKPNCWSPNIRII